MVILGRRQNNFSCKGPSMRWAVALLAAVRCGAKTGNIVRRRAAFFIGQLYPKEQHVLRKTEIVAAITSLFGRSVTKSVSGSPRRGSRWRCCRWGRQRGRGGHHLAVQGAAVAVAAGVCLGVRLVALDKAMPTGSTTGRGASRGPIAEVVERAWRLVWSAQPRSERTLAARQHSCG
jgi:hypothetical protein